MYVIFTNHVIWHRENLRSDRENTGNFKTKFEWVPSSVIILELSYPPPPPLISNSWNHSWSRWPTSLTPPPPPPHTHTPPLLPPPLPSHEFTWFHYMAPTGSTPSSLYSKVTTGSHRVWNLENLENENAHGKVLKLVDMAGKKFFHLSF